MLDLHPLSAERQGFEPRVPRSTTVFKTAAIDHSATSPNPERYSRFLCIFQKRRDRDSNPGYLAVQRFSRPPQSTTLPPLQILNDIQDSYVSFKSGETGIRTPGTSQYNGFQDRRNRPLCHLSKASLRFTEALSFKSDAKVRLIFNCTNFQETFFNQTADFLSSSSIV